MDKPQSKTIYLNPRQLYALNNLKRTNVIIAPRAWGKSTILGEYLIRCQDTMPRSRGILASATFETIRNRSLPSVQEHWERLGLQKGEDYVVGIKPKSWFDAPFNTIEDYTNVISFANGCAIDMVPLHSQRSGRGGNYWFCAIDEGLLVNEQVYRQAVIPAIRGPIERISRIPIDGPMAVPFGKVIESPEGWEWRIRLGDNPFFMSKFIVSSMPWTQSGMWLLDFEHNSNALFVEGTAEDNLAVVGEDYIQEQRESLPDLIFRIEIMNERITRLPDGFYNSWDDNRHITYDDLYRADQLLELSFDFGNFNSMLVCQHVEGAAYIHDELYVKNRTVDELVDQFLTRYRSHPTKLVHLYGDRNGNNSMPNSVMTLYESIVARLTAAGWQCVRMVEGLDPPHADKHLMINAALRQDASTSLPPIKVSYRCKHLIISIKMAPIKEGLKKDKKSEHPKSGVLPENATHFSDAFDNWYYPRFKHLNRVLSEAGAGFYMS